MATVLEEYITEEQRSAVFLWAKGLIAKHIHKLLIFGSVCSVNRFHLGGKRFADDEEIKTGAQNWRR
jgi:hypothetical protein